MQNGNLQRCLLPPLLSDIEVEQLVDQEEAREVEEEEREGPGAEPREATPHQTEKQVIIKCQKRNSSASLLMMWRSIH